jgi:4-hydroxy-4-methyl-2-oxoglutarate aldolase
MSTPLDTLIDKVRPVIASAAVSDALDAIGLHHQILPAHIRPVDDRFVICGRARTGAYKPIWHVEEGANPFLLEIELVDDLQAGEVCVFATAGNATIGPWGELLSTRAKYLGAAGMLTDGAVRDVHMIRDMGFPVFAGALSPTDSKHRGHVAAINVPVRIGEVMIRPGDVVVADMDGGCVVPADHAFGVLSAALDKISGEGAMRKDLADGMSLRDAFAKHGLL